MFARFLNTLHLTRGQKAVAIAYGAVMAVSAGITLMIMSGVEGANAIPPEPTLVDNWIIAAGGLAAGLALFLSRTWLGGLGALGIARALVAFIMVTVVAAILAGTLVAPFYGTMVAPFMLLSAFVAAPILAVAWGGVLIGAHVLFGILRREQDTVESGSAVSQLSALSQANLYGHTYRH